MFRSDFDLLPDNAAVLAAVTRIAVERVAGAEYAGITWSKNGIYRSAAETDERVDIQTPTGRRHRVVPAWGMGTVRLGPCCALHMGARCCVPELARSTSMAT